VVHIDDMTKRIDQMDTLVKQYMGKYEEAMEQLDEIPGIGKQSAETILSETGLDIYFSRHNYERVGYFEASI